MQKKNNEKILGIPYSKLLLLSTKKRMKWFKLHNSIMYINYFFKKNSLKSNACIIKCWLYLYMMYKFNAIWHGVGVGVIWGTSLFLTKYLLWKVKIFKLSV